MTPQQIVGLAVRLFSVWLVFLTLQFVGSGKALNVELGSEAGYAYFIAATVMACLAAVLWFFPMWIAHKLVPRTQFENVLRIPAHQAVTVACVIIGLWLFASHVLPGLAHFISLAFAMRVNNQPLSASDQFTIIRLGPVVIELVIAAAFCFKAHAISKLFMTDRGSRDKE
jgi:hypothetical protein